MSGQPAGVLACKGRSTFRCMSDGQRQCSPPRMVGSTPAQHLDRLVIRVDERGHDRVRSVSEYGRSRTDCGSARESLLTASSFIDGHRVSCGRCRCCLGCLQ
jgi:hypothetical protein